MPLDTFLSFFSICALIAISPGPDNIFVLLQTALYGHRVGFVIVLGLLSGIIFHTLLVTLGVAALLKASPAAFTVLKFIGAGYLLYLAYLTFKSRPVTMNVQSASEQAPATPEMNLWQYYRRGIFMNVTNPKVSLFFLAFLPQFTYSSQIPISQQMLSLSGIFVLATFVVFNSIVLFSGYFGRLLRQSPQAQVALNWLTIIVFCGLALRLLWA